MPNGRSNRIPGYIASIAVRSMIVLRASTVSTSFTTVWPVSRSVAVKVHALSAFGTAQMERKM
jgi:hypothetical protein